MTYRIFFIVSMVISVLACKRATTDTKQSTDRQPYAIAIHGGAGTILKSRMTAERETAYLEALHKALDIGEVILKNGGSALDAVEQTIVFMEDSPLFNAGKGAVFTHEGRNELDASIMSGTDRNAGAVGGVTIVKNPIRAARAVMERSDHVLLVGRGAEAFSRAQGMDIVDSSYFHTDRRWKALQQSIEAEKHGTVGAVALDNAGNIVAGTSTGGMTNKRYNRIGDSPIIGAGTYADNATCGVSCTGHGEFFIRFTVAHAVSARMAYANADLESAAHHTIHGALKDAGGTGGLIAIDRNGNVTMPFNTEGMYRGYTTPDTRVVSIYKD